MGKLIQHLLPLELNEDRNPLPPEIEEKVTLAMADLLLAILAIEERRENHNDAGQS